MVWKGLRWRNTLNNSKPYKPDSMWKAIRNKQRRAYAQGLMETVMIIEQFQGLDIEAHRAIIAHFDILEKSYES